MNTRERINCRICGSFNLRWVTSVLVVWNGAVLRCDDCHQLRLVPRV